MVNLRKLLPILAFSLITTPAFSFGNYPIHYLFEVGGYESNPGKSQDVNLTGLIGDRFTHEGQRHTRQVYGAGVLVTGIDRPRYDISYGVNAFYFNDTTVNGQIIQEHIFTNLSYRYNVSHFPIFALVKARLKTDYKTLAVTFDGGIGPNFLTTSRYGDTSLDGITVPDDAYKGNQSIVFAAMAGVGLQYTFMNQYPIELGYKIFYLNEGYLQPQKVGVLSKLMTGENIAQSLMLTFSC